MWTRFLIYCTVPTSRLPAWPRFQIASISGLHAVPTLRVLMLGKNQIEVIEGLAPLKRRAAPNPPRPLPSNNCESYEYPDVVSGRREACASSRASPLPIPLSEE